MNKNETKTKDKFKASIIVEDRYSNIEVTKEDFERDLKDLLFDLDYLVLEITTEKLSIENSKT